MYIVVLNENDIVNNNMGLANVNITVVVNDNDIANNNMGVAHVIKFVVVYFHDVLLHFIVFVL